MTCSIPTEMPREVHALTLWCGPARFHTCPISQNILLVYEHVSWITVELVFICCKLFISHIQCSFFLKQHFNAWFFFFLTFFLKPFALKSHQKSAFMLHLTHPSHPHKYNWLPLFKTEAKICFFTSSRVFGNQRLRTKNTKLHNWYTHSQLPKRLPCCHSKCHITLF